MLAPVVLAALLRACAAGVHPQTQAALVAAESAGDSWALGDNTTRRMYRPTSYEEATRLAYALLARGDSVDVGIGQINSANFAREGVTVEQMLDPCANLRVSSRMLARAYRTEYVALGATPQAAQAALTRTLEVYNSGKPWGDDRYAALVRQQLGTVFVRNTTAFSGEAPVSLIAPPPPIARVSPKPTQAPPSALFYHRDVFVDDASIHGTSTHAPVFPVTQRASHTSAFVQSN